MKSPGDYTDSELVDLLTKGDRKAFEAIYKIYAAPLYKYARHIVSNKEDCEEMVQAIFEKLWFSHKTLKILALKAYLYGAIRNQILDYFKHVEVKRRYADHYRAFAQVYDSLHEDSPNTEKTRLIIEQGIKEMPERVQVAIKLRLTENLSNTEIAQRMNVTNKTVENYMHMVYAHFRQTYSSLYKASQ